MTLSLDANVLVDLVNGRRPVVRDRFDEALVAGDAVVTCSFAAHELLYGASVSARPDVQLAAAHSLFSQVAVVEFSLADARGAASLRAELKRAGEPIGILDALIAGQALHRGWTVITGNVREFARVPGLRVIDWTAPAKSP